MKECEEDWEKDELKWILFDGPVDAQWIENMNTVLDDNKVLCLTNGQKIKLSPKSTMMFEVEDLLAASPATVSRCGMILMEQDQVHWTILVQSLAQFNLKGYEQFHKSIRYNFDWFLYSIFSYIKIEIKLPLVMNEMILTNNSLRIFKALIAQFEISFELEKKKNEFEHILIDLVLFSVSWGVGGSLDQDGRAKLNQFLLKLVFYDDVRQTFGVDIPMENWQPRGLNLKIENLQNFFNYLYNVQTLSWQPWLPDKTVDIGRLKGLRFDQIIIPTDDSVRNSYFLIQQISQGNNVLFCGPTGTGKTVGILSDIETNY